MKLVSSALMCTFLRRLIVRQFLGDPVMLHLSSVAQVNWSDFYPTFTFEDSNVTQDSTSRKLGTPQLFSWLFYPTLSYVQTIPKE